MNSLTDLLPIRQNTVWGAWAGAISSGSESAIYLPHRYGICGGELIQYDQNRTQFVWADHAVQSIDTVLVNGVAVQGWQFANVNDTTGHVVAMVTLSQPLDQGSTVIARGKGKLHPVNGNLMTDPAEVLWDVLANIAGRDVSESAFEPFSNSCTARGLVAAGSIETIDTIAAVVLAMVGSFGAVFSAPDVAIIWPDPDIQPTLTDISEDLGHVLTAQAQLSGIVNDFTINYDYEAGVHANRSNFRQLIRSRATGCAQHR